MALLRGLLVCSLLLLSCICKEALGTRLPGGREDASLEEPGVRKALQFAVNEYNRGSNDMYSSRVSEVVEVQKQIVRGIKYYFAVKIGRTVCRKGATTDHENCAFHTTPKPAQTMTCTFEVYSIPWRNIISLEKSSCA
ncbi:cystatin-2 [Protobothrops mucrosquamatus]|uniref:cystatin-2 n=1 Tax=Protobothrops mucrosquamatus TaxID=103944 RepID=UPI000775E87E|nr:cystatin-2 [Protobothrops mucrosquamatus]